MSQTTYWMLGVVAFGVVFYAFAMYYHKTGHNEDE